MAILAVALPCWVWPVVARGASDWVPPSNLQTLQLLFRQPEQIPFPADAQFTAERELLGRTLFFDPRLSGSGVLACATCHNPSFGWGDGMQLGRGEGLQQLGRRTPTVLNAAWGGPYFWDGRAATLEAQAAGPIGSPKEMNQNLALLPAKLKAIDGYQALFDRAYPGEPIGVVTITKAIATFERTVSSGRTPFDDWLDGDEGAVNAASKRGFVLFAGRAGCSACHTGWAFTDNKFHDIGLVSVDAGRVLVAPGEANADHAFKTPTLRDVARRAPYMHDGQMRDMSAVIRHYIAGGDRPSNDPLMRQLNVTQADVEDLIAFLDTLSGPAKSFPAPILPR